MQESSKNELLFSIDNFNRPAIKKGLYSRAKLVENLIMMKKRTYPTAPDMGIFIQQYKFEFIDEILGKVQSDIEQQIRTYIPDLQLQQVVVKKINRNVLAVGIGVKNPSTGEDEAFVLKLKQNNEKLLVNVLTNNE